MADTPTSFLYLDPELVSYGCAYCGDQLVGEVAVTSSDGTAHIDESSLKDWFGAELMFYFDEDGSGWIVLRIYARSLFISEDTFRQAQVRVYADGGGEAYLIVRQRGMGASLYTAVVTPETLEAPADGGLTDWVSVEVTDGAGYIVRGASPIVDADTLPDWVVGVEYDPDNGTIAHPRFRLTVAANGTGERREGDVYFGMLGSLIAHVDVVQDAPSVPEWKPAHSGEFLDIRGNTWRAEILRLTTDEVTPSELEFPADRPLTLEWPSSAFEDALWGSSATLRVVSPGDRTYIDLYTVEPGTIRLDVYRNGSLYWSGMLDPEFYEEPYERLNGYEVSLTFTDFGILDRLEYDLAGVQAVTDIIARAVEASGVTAATPDLSLVQIGAGDLHVDSDNFTDEEGEVMSWREALEGVLTPLGLRMVQRGGRIVLFDLAGLKVGGAVSAAVWAGDSQTLGVDRVYNKVAVTFSPYAQSELLEDAVSFGAEVSEDDTCSDPAGAERDGMRFWTFYNANGDKDFNLYLSADGSGVTFGQVAPLAQYFHILPISGGADECTGVPYFFCTNGDAYIGTSFGRKPCAAASSYSDWALTAPRIYVRGDTTYRWLLRVVMEILVDCRHDPFDTDDGDTDQERLERSSAFVFLSARVSLYDAAEGGNVLYHLENALAADYGHTDLEITMRKWVEGSRSSDDVISAPFWFEWYNPDDLTDNSGGAGGWKADKHNIGRPDGAVWPAAERVSSRLRNAPDGEFIPLPPVSGWLEILVGDDLTGFKYGDSKALKYQSDSDTWGDEGVRDHLTWFLLKCPEVHIVRNDTLFTEETADDVKYTGALAAGAADELDIDTVCGTADGVPPTARGLFLTADGSPVSELTRDGVTARPEELLIGQLYGQYAARKAVITGEAEIPESLLLTEDNQEGKTFILAGDTQDARMATSDIEIRELGDDIYYPES